MAAEAGPDALTASSGFQGCAKPYWNGPLATSITARSASAAGESQALQRQPLQAVALTGFPVLPSPGTITSCPELGLPMPQAPVLPVTQRCPRYRSSTSHPGDVRSWAPACLPGERVRGVAPARASSACPRGEEKEPSAPYL